MESSDTLLYVPCYPVFTYWDGLILLMGLLLMMWRKFLTIVSSDAESSSGIVFYWFLWMFTLYNILQNADCLHYLTS